MRKKRQLKSEKGKENIDQVVQLNNGSKTCQKIWADEVCPASRVKGTSFWQGDYDLRVSADAVSDRND